MLTAKRLEKMIELEEKLRAEYQEQLDAKPFWFRAAARAAGRAALAGVNEAHTRIESAIAEIGPSGSAPSTRLHEAPRSSDRATPPW